MRKVIYGLEALVIAGVSVYVMVSGRPLLWLVPAVIGAICATDKLIEKLIPKK